MAAICIVLMFAILATSCQGADPQVGHVKRQNAWPHLQHARAKIEKLKKSKDDLAKDLERTFAQVAELESLLRELAVGDGSSSCPIESAPHKRPDVPAVAFAYGDGPVFVGLGTGDGVVLYTLDSMRHKGWYYYKTLWAIDPSYTGRVTITGQQIDGSNRLRFNAGSGFPGKKQLELRLPPTDSREWRLGPSSTLIRGPGCYTFRATGDGFEQMIIFKAIG